MLQQPHDERMVLAVDGVHQRGACLAVQHVDPGREHKALRFLDGPVRDGLADGIRRRIKLAGSAGLCHGGSSG